MREKVIFCKDDGMLEDYIQAHKYSIRNRTQLEKSTFCGCFYCKRIYNPAEIHEWVDENGVTALCPYCGIDSVIGDASGYPLGDEFLHTMHNYWFST